MGPIAALTSDVWYTLVYLRGPDQLRLERARRATWSLPLRRSGRTRPETERAVEALERWTRHLEARGQTPSIVAQAAWLSRRTRVPLDGNDVAEALDALADAAPVRPAPGARKALGRIRDAGIPLGLVSNVLHETGPGLRRLLASLGLLEYFRSQVFSSEHPWSKPRPEPFRHALAELGARPERAVHVGDLTYDVLGARRAGMRPILYTGLHRFEPARLAGLIETHDRSVERVSRWSELPSRLLGPEDRGRASPPR